MDILYNGINVKSERPYSTFVNPEHNRIQMFNKNGPRLPVEQFGKAKVKDSA